MSIEETGPSCDSYLRVVPWKFSFNVSFHNQTVLDNVEDFLRVMRNFNRSCNQVWCSAWVYRNCPSLA